MRDPQERLAWLVEQARQRPEFPEDLRTERWRVHGCTARLWLVCELHGGAIGFRCDSDSLIVKSVAGLLCDFYSGADPAEIVATPPDFLSAVGIDHHLTPNRRNSLGRVWESIRDCAEVHRRTHPNATLPK